jgi:hypothetical protein
MKRSVPRGAGDFEIPILPPHPKVAASAVLEAGLQLARWLRKTAFEAAARHLRMS